MNFPMIFKNVELNCKYYKDLKGQQKGESKFIRPAQSSDI